MVQEVWLRWQKQQAGDIQSPKAWLVSATTRLCIDQCAPPGVSAKSITASGLPEPLMSATETDPGNTPGLADSLTMAFMLMLNRSAPSNARCFCCAKCSATNIADTVAIVDKSEANCRQIVRRAKAQARRRCRAVHSATARPSNWSRLPRRTAAAMCMTPRPAHGRKRGLQRRRRTRKAAGHPILGAEHESIPVRPAAISSVSMHADA